MDLKSDKSKLERTFMKDEVYDVLRKWIITGKLEPGTKLKLQELADILGTSRTPVREALLKLENDELVITKANRWTLVAPIDLKNGKNIYSIIWTLECLGLNQAFPNITSKDINELELFNEKFNVMKTENQLERWQADNKFHDKIIQVSNNSELQKILFDLKVQVQRIEIKYFNKIDTMHSSYKEHKKIIQAIKESNLDSAKKHLKSNWENSLKRIQKYSNSQ